MNSVRLPIKPLAIVASIFVLNISAAWADDASGVLVADTYVTSAHKSFGTAKNFMIGGGATGLLRFDLSTLPKNLTAADVEGAKLILFPQKIYADGELDVVTVDSPVLESVTALPTIYSTPVPTIPNPTGFKAGNLVSVDVTEQVKSWITIYNPYPYDNNGLALLAPGSFKATFDSKESTTSSHPPQLLITLSSNHSVAGHNQWDTSGSEGDFRVGNDNFRLKVGVALDGSGAGDVRVQADGGSKHLYLIGNGAADLISTDTTPNSIAGGVVNVNASGVTNVYTNAARTSGVTIAAGSGTWNSLSDRGSKENLQAIDGSDILSKLVELPISTWNYKTQAESIRHIGPMAQDFYAAFNVGEDNKHISTVDEGGVALAAIQGLYQKLQESEAKLSQKDAQIQALQTRTEKLESELEAIKAELNTQR